MLHSATVLTRNGVYLCSAILCSCTTDGRLSTTVLIRPNIILVFGTTTLALHWRCLSISHDQYGFYARQRIGMNLLAVIKLPELDVSPLSLFLEHLLDDSTLQFPLTSAIHRPYAPTAQPRPRIISAYLACDGVDGRVIPSGNYHIRQQGLRVLSQDIFRAPLSSGFAL